MAKHDPPTLPFPIHNRGGPAEEPDDEIDLLAYWRILAERRGLVLGCIGATLLLGFVTTLLTTPMYEASISLKIERQAPDILTYQDVVGVDPMAYKDFYQTQYKLISSRVVLRRAVDQLSLVNRPEFAARTESGLTRGTSWLRSRLGAGEGRRSPLNEALEFVERELSVEPLRNSHLVRIGFLDRDPELARDVVAAVADAYQNFNLEARYATNENASEFLEKEVLRTQAEIAELEQQLQTYGTEREILSLSDGAQDISEQALADQNQRLTVARGQLALAQARWETVRDASARSLLEVLQDTLIGGLMQEHAEMERSYSDQAQRFKADWPGLIALKGQIAQSGQRLEAEIEATAGRVRSAARNAHDQALAEVDILTRQLDDQKRIVQRVNHDAIQHGALRTEITTRRSVLAELVARRSQTETSGQLRDAGASNIRVVDPAEVPDRRAKPSLFINLLVSLMLGSALGVGAAFLLHYVDNTIKTEADIAQYGVGMPVLGHIPFYDPVRDSREDTASPDAIVRSVDWGSAVAPTSPFAEAFRNLRTSLLLATPDHPPRVILVTSCEPVDGKSVISLNLATVLTQLGRRVLLIDGDLRRPRLHRSLSLDNARGVSSFLTGNADLDDLFSETVVPGLKIITSGPVPPNPSELLGSPALGTFIDRLIAMGFDHIVIDSPPTVQVADSVLLATKADATILVTRSGATPRDSLTKAASRMRNGRVRLAGVVLNAVSERGGYYRYGYYGPRPEDSDQRDDRRRGRTGRSGWRSLGRRAG